MQDLRIDDRASRIGTLIGTIVACGIFAVIAIDIINALGWMHGA